MNNYYVYFYTDPKSNNIVYVGKGKKNRAFSHLVKSGNKRLHNMIQKRLKEGYHIHPTIIECGSESTAFYMERFWVSAIGRLDLEAGTLFNHTDGGDGTSGAIKSKESRQRMSDFWKNNPNGNTPYALCDKEKHRETMLKPELWSQIRATSLEKFGVEHYAKTDTAKEQYKKICLERYGVDNYSKSQEFKYSISGDNHPLKKPENRAKCSEAAKRPETIAKRLKTVSEQPLIICKTCGCVGKRQMINRYHNDNCGTKKPHNRKNIKVYDKSGNESYITLVQFKAQGDLKKNTDHFEFCSSMSPEGKRRKLLRGKL